MNVQEWMSGWSRKPDEPAVPRPVAAHLPPPPPGERRRHFRKPVALAARVRSRDASGTMHDHIARTLDLSMGGTCVASDALLERGAVVEIELLQQGLTFRSGASVVGVGPGELRLEFLNLGVVAKDVLSMTLTGGLLLSGAM